jgi:transcription-repair coupling factor (superfamily II helicase)
MTRTLPRREFLKATRLIKVNQVITPDSLKRVWVDLGYLPADTVLEPGQFSHRGGILDVWTPLGMKLIPSVHSTRGRSEPPRP